MLHPASCIGLIHFKVVINACQFCGKHNAFCGILLGGEIAHQGQHKISTFSVTTAEYEVVGMEE